MGTQMSTLMFDVAFFLQQLTVLSMKPQVGGNLKASLGGI
jgi:hypothetical protein